MLLGLEFTRDRAHTNVGGCLDAGGAVLGTLQDGAGQVWEILEAGDQSGSTCQTEILQTQPHVMGCGSVASGGWARSLRVLGQGRALGPLASCSVE